MRIDINRQKAGLEDLLFGVGTELQPRQGDIVEVTKINASNMPYDGEHTLGEIVPLILEADARLQAHYEEIDVVAHDLEEENSEITAVANNMGLVDIVGQDLANQYAYIEDNGSITNPVEADEGISRIGTVAENIDSVIIVADNIDAILNIDTNITDVNTVATNIVDINTTATNIADVNTVATNITDINTIVTNIVDVNTVATNIADVNIVSENIVDINTVATNIADVNTTAENITDVNTVATNIADINTTAENITDVNTVASLSTDITFLVTNWDNKVDTTDIGITVQGYNINLTSIGGLANTTGWLKNNGSGAFTYSTLTASDVGLGNVDNTSDINKPISTATQTALDAKLSQVSGVIDLGLVTGSVS